jgi:anti-sigma B factor antagonist
VSRTSHLQIRQRRVGPVVILDLDGEIAIGTGSTELREHISSLLARGSKKILINLRSVDYIDSFGLAELVRVHEMTERYWGEIKLVNLSSRVQSFVQLTGLVTVFEMFDGERDAIISFARVHSV